MGSLWYPTLAEFNVATVADIRECGHSWLVDAKTGCPALFHRWSPWWRRRRTLIGGHVSKSSSNITSSILLSFGSDCRHIKICYSKTQGTDVIADCFCLTLNFFSKWPSAAILDLIQPEIAPFDPPSPITPPYRTKHEIDRMTRCRGMARHFQNVRSVAGRQYSYFLHWCHIQIIHVLLFRCVMKVAREERKW